MQVVVSCPHSRPYLLAVCAVALGCLLFSAGCDCNKAGNAPPPPQSLSEPIRPSENITPAPAVPDTGGSRDFTAQHVGETRALPQVSAATLAAPAPTPKSAARLSTKFHTLAKGETLYAVARKYGVRPRALIEANHFKDPSHVPTGTKVYLPN